MRIVAIADTHGICPSLPEGDVLIHAGDGTMLGTLEEANTLDDWFGSLDFEHIIYVPGNHDFSFEQSAILRNALVLHSMGIMIDGVKFWGSPYAPIFGAWAFMRSEGSLEYIWQMIPHDTDILITHGPPYGILDKTLDGRNVGSTTLRGWVDTFKPSVHLFGHIHEAFGMISLDKTFFGNVSIVSEYCQYVNKPLVMNY